MSILYSYFAYLAGWNEDDKPKIEENALKPAVKKFLISSDDLIKINLNSTKDIIPGPSRNMPPIDTFELSNFNKAQLEEILSIKLKPTKVNIKPDYYPPKNPVIRQMNEKFGIGIIST